MLPPSDADAALYPARWVAQRLGVNSRTLRNWHVRYGLSPSGRTTGGHRRYSVGDVERLELMCRLIAGGFAVEEAARLSHPGVDIRRQALPAGASAASARHLELLDRAVLELDQHTANTIIDEVLRTRRVVSAWTDVLAPALRLRGEQFGRTANGVNVEHLLSECVRAALSALAWRPRSWRDTRPVLLAAPEGEQHTLPLYALAAALAEENRPHVLLGASVPDQALADSTELLDPAAVFLWSHAPDTARRPETTPSARPPGPVLVVGGPGWPEHATGRVDTLARALHACVEPTRPVRNGAALSGCAAGP